MNQPDVLILGGGAAGMSAAFELHKARRSFQIIEKNNAVGGLARTIQFGEFRTDIGPHRFFSQNRHLYNFIEDLLGERWIRVERLTRFYIKEKFFNYPIDLKNALANVGLKGACRILRDFAGERLKEVVVRKELCSFEDHVVSKFGRALAELNMLNYTEKIWGMPCSDISPDWADQRIKGVSFKEVVKKALRKSGAGPKSLVDQFYYPDLGTGEIYEKIAERISINGNGCLKTKTRPVLIIHDGCVLTEIVVDGEHGRERYKPDLVISSIPLTEFIHLMKPKAPDEVLKAIDNLRYRSHVSLFLTLNRPSVFPDQWIYFPEEKVPFGRIMEPKNFSKQMSPPDKTSLLIEFFCWENDAIWKADRQDLCEMAVAWLERHKFIQSQEVINSFIHREKYAYPVYDLNYRKNVDKVLQYLAGFRNFQSIGRFGLFRYNNQDHAMEMGIRAAKNLLEGRRFNIEEVGAEREYLERGYLSANA